MTKSLASLDEEALIILCKSQLPYDVTGFEEIVQRHQKKVINLCRRYLSVESDAEDATQEIFMKVFHAFPAFDGRSAFTTWLFSIAINHCKTILAKNKLHHQRYEYGNEQCQEEYQDDTESTDIQMESEEEKKCIQYAIQQMKPNDRDLILLRFSSGLPLNDIARVVGKKMSATKMGFYRALDKFKALYEQYCN